MQAVFRGLDMNDAHRSGCPINLTLEILGDKWSLLILRDMIFGGKRHFRELMRIAGGNRLQHPGRSAQAAGARDAHRADDPSHKQKAIYSLTEMGIALVPVFAQMAPGVENICRRAKSSASARNCWRRAARPVGRVHGRAARGASGECRRGAGRNPALLSPPGCKRRMTPSSPSARNQPLVLSAVSSRISRHQVMVWVAMQRDRREAQRQARTATFGFAPPTRFATNV